MTISNVIVVYHDNEQRLWSMAFARVASLGAAMRGGVSRMGAAGVFVATADRRLHRSAATGGSCEPSIGSQRNAVRRMCGPRTGSA